MIIAVCPFSKPSVTVRVSPLANAVAWVDRRAQHLRRAGRRGDREVDEVDAGGGQRPDRRLGVREPPVVGGQVEELVLAEVALAARAARRARRIGTCSRSSHDGRLEAALVADAELDPGRRTASMARPAPRRRSWPVASRRRRACRPRRRPRSARRGTGAGCRASRRRRRGRPARRRRCWQLVDRRWRRRGSRRCDRVHAQHHPDVRAARARSRTILLAPPPQADDRCFDHTRSQLGPAPRFQCRDS